MSKITGNEPAYPITYKELSKEVKTFNKGLPNEFSQEIIVDSRMIPSGGLSKREFFAAMAMQGMAASDDWAGNFDTDPVFLKKAMDVAVKSADALINELNKSNE